MSHPPGSRTSRWLAALSVVFPATLASTTAAAQPNAANHGRGTEVLDTDDRPSVSKFLRSRDDPDTSWPGTPARMDPALAGEDEEDAAAASEERSPWMFAPVLSSNPKLGTSFGALVGYVHYFDERSRPSIFAVTGQYSSTDSIVAGVQARTSFDEDRQRLIAGMLYGYVKNDYDDYLGTGVPLKSNGELHSFIARYLYRIAGNWFVGGQGIYQNFGISGESAFDDTVLDVLGVQSYTSGGLGAVVYYDSRDDENTPTDGRVFSVNNMAYREALGGEQDFDVYRVDFRWYTDTGHKHIFALRQLNHLTDDAPTAARASVQLRGYKIGQFNSEYMSQIEAEERWRLAERWTATTFAGVGYLYGGSASDEESDNYFPMAGAGVQYLLKPKEGIVLNLEYAQGEEGNNGVLLKIGYAF